MSLEQLLPPRSFAFGSLDDGLWGACWLSLPADRDHQWTPGGDTHPLALADGSQATIVQATLSDGGPSDPWQIAADGVELELTPSSPPPPDPPSQAADPGVDQICQVEGTVTVGGRSQTVACLGWRGSGGPLEEAGRVQSFRQLAAWFGPGEGLALLAVRPRSAKGQDQDLIAATALDPERPQVVAEPRLSTTYDAAAQPVRAGLELWLGEDEEEQHSRRAAGEAAGDAAPISWTAGPLELRARLFRWHSAGRDGAGVYLSGRIA